MAVVCPFYGGGTMPEFTTVSVQEAQLRAIPGRQGQFINEYADYIQQLPQGQAGKLRIGEDEKQTTVRRRLVSAAKAMNISLTIKRSGNDMYFWRENGGDEQPRRKQSYTRRNKRQEETAEQYFGETGELELGEIRQTESAAPDQAFSEPEYPAEDKYPGMTVPFEPDLPNSKD
jgi:hypothetical protein